MLHVPVLKKEVLEYFAPKPNQNFVDCTFGAGGHSLAIIKKIKPEGKILGIEADPELFKKNKSRIKNKKNLVLVNGSYTELKRIAEENGFERVSGVLFDFGMSSWHLEESGRGFSFQKQEPLDMRYNPKETNLTAQRIVNEWSQGKIHKTLRKYGEKRFATKIARQIVKERKKSSIKTTDQLVEIIKKAIPFRFHSGKTHPATKTFQALRIAVNDELKNIEKGLNQSLKIIKPKGRIVAISFHSLEDRIVKNFFKKYNRFERIKILTDKPISPSFEEVKRNPRSRSAKLRAAKIIH